MIKNKGWVAKDVIFLGVDDRFLNGYPIYQFLNKYLSKDLNDGFARIGTIRQGIAF